MNLFLTTLGCRLNEAEIATWSTELKNEGHDVVALPDEADVVVVNTCAVTHEATRKSRKLVGSLHRKNPKAKIVVTGCFATLDAQKSAELEGVDLVVSNRDKDSLVQTIGQKIVLDNAPSRWSRPGKTNLVQLDHNPKTRRFIKVQDGCRNQCSFCIVTSLRGEEKSRTEDDIVEEIDLAYAMGQKEVVLTGVHLGGYGHDLGTTLSDLVRNILNRTKIPRLRLSSLEPWDLPKDFATLWQSPRLMPHLHLPLQSGCDATLKRMARRCMVKSYKKLVDSIRANVPDVSITTDLIVGFPGETDEEWNQTMATVESIGFSDMHIFTYSPREGTKAASLPDKVPHDVAKKRSKAMHAMANDMKQAFLKKNLDTMRSVLWEKQTVDQDGFSILSGYSDNYFRARRRVKSSSDFRGTVEGLRVKSYSDNGQLHFG